MSDQLKEIGKRIREIRLSKKMSQEEVAYKAKTSVCNISDIEPVSYTHLTLPTT